MLILNDVTTSLRKALEEIDPKYETYKGLVIAGTHNQQNIEEYLEKIRYARENGTPTLLICAGHQLGAIEYARNVLGIKDATSEEFGKGTFVIKKRQTPKIGLHDGESWWSYYDVAIDYKPSEHFISVPFHPEYSSSIDKKHPLLVNFIKKCKSE